MDHYDTNAFVDVIAVEGKFLKEANKLNYLQGDNVKFGLWDSIKKIIPREMLPHLTIANRAGSFLLGIHKDTEQEIVDQLSDMLTQLHKADIVIRGNRIEVPLGIARESDQPEIHRFKAGEKIAKLRAAADMSWYKELV